MHSIRMITKDSWEVVLIRGEEPRQSLFDMLSFTQAAKLCNFLNGGNAEFDAKDWHYIEHCAVK